MNRIDKYKYHVVKFLENPFKDTETANCDDVCVPRSWLKWCSPEDNIVKVWYPTQDLRNIEKKVRKREKKSDQWASFLSVLKYSSDIYEDSKIYILHKKNLVNNTKEDRTRPFSAIVEEKTSKTTSSVIQNKATVENVIDGIGWRGSSKSTNTITLKRRATADSDKPAHRKRSRVNEPSESVDEVAGPSSQAFELRSNNQTLPHKNSNDDLCLQETPVVKSNDRNSTEKKQIENKNDSKVNQLPILVKCCKLILELQKYLDNSLVREILNKLMNTDNSRSVLSNDTIASATSDATVQAPKLNEEKRNEEKIKENDFDEDDDCGDDDDDDINTDNSKSVLTNDTIASASSDTKVLVSKLNEEKRNVELIEDNVSDNDDDCGHDDDDDINTDNSKSANDTNASASSDTTVLVCSPRHGGNSMDELKYNVVQVLESPLKDMADYWCVSRAWVQIRGPNDPKVNVTFPFDTIDPKVPPLPTERQLMKRKKKSREMWRTFLSVVKYRTDSYGDAKRYMKELLDNEDKNKIYKGNLYL